MGVAMKYRTYDAAWNRTGWADAPQYPGQAPVVDGMDYPLDARVASLASPNGILTAFDAAGKVIEKVAVA
jgi:hypothetical protein